MTTRKLAGELPIAGLARALARAAAGRILLAAVSLGSILASAPSFSAEADWPSFWARWSVAITKGEMERWGQS